LRGIRWNEINQRTVTTIPRHFGKILRQTGGSNEPHHAIYYLGENENAKTRTPFSLNIILLLVAFALYSLRALMSTLYLAIKYPLDNRKVGSVKGDQATTRKCNQVSLKVGQGRVKEFHA
jgi:hypothetical protein